MNQDDSVSFLSMTRQGLTSSIGLFFSPSWSRSYMIQVLKKLTPRFFSAVMTPWPVFRTTSGQHLHYIQKRLVEATWDLKSDFFTVPETD
ncbi:hypothetical protein E2C01_102100 [Portunus trituberculatus]|uniref:Uncharacterized protein n=1 Tax=Portunus trituberculatus TaxID=210409 RepID=A0A5B7KNE8_PORTR|nr:hypothetical protein [Portunus trituberculatus]